MRSLDQFAAAKLEELEQRHLRRRPRPTDRGEAPWVVRDGRTLLSFSCNDYLNLSVDPRIKAASAAAVERYGAGAGASRLVTGEHPLIGELEARLARLKGAEAACLFGSGYLANAGVMPTFIGPNDVIFVDELAHACIWAGATLSGAEVVAFRHNDVVHLAGLLKQVRAAYPRAMIATDGVFSMDGDLAPLDALSSLADAHDAWLLSDDAHGIGVLADGRGSAALFPQARIPLQMGTLSKALGGYGGYLCGSQAVVDLLKTRARTAVYSTGLPPAAAGAALAALEVIEAEPELTCAPLRKARAFAQVAGLPEPQSPIVPLMIGEADAALAASHALEREGFLAMAIRPPTVPQGTARLRLAFSAAHPDHEVARLGRAVRELRVRAPA